MKHEGTLCFLSVCACVCALKEFKATSDLVGINGSGFRAVILPLCSLLQPTSSTLFNLLPHHAAPLRCANNTTSLRVTAYNLGTGGGGMRPAPSYHGSLNSRT